MQFSEHFDIDEFDRDAPIPDECVDVAKQFCTLVLEPIRAMIDEPMEITSGYRPDAANAATHGAPHSEHIWTARACAADFTFNTSFGKMLSVRALFDLIRQSPSIPFHQVILEHGPTGSSIIHVSYNLDKLGVRQALEGATHNASPYTSWEVATYIPTAPGSGQENA